MAFKNLLNSIRLDNADEVRTIISSPQGRFLVDKPINVHGHRPLHMATYNENIQIVRILIEAGANVNIQNKVGDTPLHLATNNENIHIIRILIEAGADVNKRNNNGILPLDNNINKEYSNNNYSILIMLIRAGTDLNSQDNDGYTPLHVATSAIDTYHVEILIQAGADKNVQNKNGDTPLHLATRLRNFYAIKKLVEAGADMNVQNNNGKTPLQVIDNDGNDDVSEIEVAICELLISSGATKPEFKNPVLRNRFNGEKPYNSKKFFDWFKQEPDMDCAICYHTLANEQDVCMNMTEGCVHGFHCECIQQWLDTGNRTKCPICRIPGFDKRNLSDDDQKRLLELASGTGDNGFGKRKSKTMTLAQVNKLLRELKYI